MVNSKKLNLLEYLSFNENELNSRNINQVMPVRTIELPAFPQSYSQPDNHLKPIGSSIHLPWDFILFIFPSDIFYPPLIK